MTRHLQCRKCNKTFWGKYGQKYCSDCQEYSFPLGSFCKMCGENDRRCLAKHHINNNHGNNESNNLLIVCFNCHRKLHLAKINEAFETLDGIEIPIPLQRQRQLDREYG